LRLRHEAAARLVTEYEFNNTYQYIVNREDAQLSWLESAIEDLGGRPADSAAVPEPTAPDSRLTDTRAILKEDIQLAQQFADDWRDRVEAMTHARHRGMLRVVLGETLEHKRFFEQALAGRTDLLGRHVDGAGTVGKVLPTRWVG
jgi:hypothetical protein